MKPVKKFKTFDELKSCENKEMDKASTLKYHFDFEILIEKIRKVKEGEAYFSHHNK